MEMATMSETEPTQAATAIKNLSEGDVIHVPQYETELRVMFTGDVSGVQNAMVGVEFTETTGARKTMVVNKHSGRVYLTAGNTDKGEVTEIDVVQEARR